MLRLQRSCYPTWPSSRACKLCRCRFLLMQVADASDMEYIETVRCACASPLPQDLIRRVEQQQRRDQLEDVTAQLMLLSAVRKVRPLLQWAAAATHTETPFVGVDAS